MLLWEGSSVAELLNIFVGSKIRCWNVEHFLWKEVKVLKYWTFSLEGSSGAELLNDFVGKKFWCWNVEHFFVQVLHGAEWPAFSHASGHLHVSWPTADLWPHESHRSWPCGRPYLPHGVSGALWYWCCADGRQSVLPQMMPEVNPCVHKLLSYAGVSFFFLFFFQKVKASVRTVLVIPLELLCSIVFGRFSAQIPFFFLVVIACFFVFFFSKHSLYRNVRWFCMEESACRSCILLSVHFKSRCWLSLLWQ